MMNGMENHTKEQAEAMWKIKRKMQDCSVRYTFLDLWDWYEIHVEH